MVSGSEQWGDVMLDWRFEPLDVLWVDLTKGTVQGKEIPHDWLIESMGEKALQPACSLNGTTDYESAMQLQHPVLDQWIARHPTSPLCS